MNREYDIGHHLPGHERCDKGWCNGIQWPRTCSCGGLVHANKAWRVPNVELFTKCDRCGLEQAYGVSDSERTVWLLHEATDDKDGKMLAVYDSLESLTGTIRAQWQPEDSITDDVYVGLVDGHIAYVAKRYPLFSLGEWLYKPVEA